MSAAVASTPPVEGRAALGGALSLVYLLVGAVLITLLANGLIRGTALLALTVLVPIVTLCVLRAVQSSRLNPVSIFIALTSLFSFGQSWRDILGLHAAPSDAYPNLADMFPTTVLDRAISLAITAIVVIAIGSIVAAFALPAQRAQPADASSHQSHPSRVLWLTGGLGLLGFVLAGDAQRSASVAELGYGDGYKFVSPILYTANYVFPIVVIAVMLTWRDSRRFVGMVLAAALARNLYVILAVQNRGQAVSEAVVYLLVWNTYYGFPKRWKWPSLMLGVGVLALLPYVSVVRSGVGDRDFLSFLLEHNVLSSFLTEFGGSLATVAYSVQYLDAGGQTMGPLYLVSLLGTAIPGFGSALIDAAGNPLTAENLNSYFGRSGLGGSFVADLSLNIGSGPLALGVTMALGFVLTLLARAQSDLADPRTYRLIWCWFVYLGAIVAVRGYLTDLATAVKVGGVVILLMWFITQGLGSPPTRRNDQRSDTHERYRRRVSRVADQAKDEG